MTGAPARHGDARCQTFEASLARSGVGEALRYLELIVRQDVDAEKSGTRDQRVRRRCAIDADQDRRRIEAETLVNALAVNPSGLPSTTVVTIVTPVAKRRIAARKSSLDTSADSYAAPDRENRRIELRVFEEDSVEIPHGAHARRVVILFRLLGYLSV